jgi:hypothetical protein
MDAQKALAEAVEAHMTDASLLLHRLQESVAEIDQTDDQTTKRQVIERLVHGIRIDTLPNTGPTATITYAFTPERVVCNTTRSSAEGA